MYKMNKITLRKPSISRLKDGGAISQTINQSLFNKVPVNYYDFESPEKIIEKLLYPFMSYASKCNLLRIPVINA